MLLLRWRRELTEDDRELRASELETQSHPFDVGVKAAVSILPTEQVDRRLHSRRAICGKTNIYVNDRGLISSWPSQHVRPLLDINTALLFNDLEVIKAVGAKTVHTNQYRESTFPPAHGFQSCRDSMHWGLGFLVEETGRDSEIRT
jgi:hypothetical protein